MSLLSAHRPLTRCWPSTPAVILASVVSDGLLAEILYTQERHASLQDRFEQLLPALSKYASVTVGLTLLLIGALGLVEARAEPEEEAEALLASELRLAPAGEADEAGFFPRGALRLLYSQNYPSVSSSFLDLLCPAGHMQGGLSRFPVQVLARAPQLHSARRASPSQSSL